MFSITCTENKDYITIGMRTGAAGCGVVASGRFGFMNGPSVANMGLQTPETEFSCD